MSECLSVRVNLAQRSYDIYIGYGLLPYLGTYAVELFPQKKKCAIITDSNVAPLYAETVANSLAEQGIEAILITVPAGEASKCMGTVEEVCREMLKAGLDRHAFLRPGQ